MTFCVCTRSPHTLIHILVQQINPAQQEMSVFLAVCTQLYDEVQFDS